MTTTAKSVTAKKKTGTTAKKKTSVSRTPRKKRPAPEPEVNALNAAEPPVPNHDEIAMVAFFIYQQRIAEGLPGDAVSDWYAAEEEIMSEVNVPALT